MQKDHAGFIFEPTAEIFKQMEWFDYTRSGNEYAPRFKLRLQTTYTVGYLFTDAGTRVKGMLARPETLSFSLFSADRSCQIRAFEPSDEAAKQLDIADGEIVPFFNCHGFTFTESNYWINDDQVNLILAGDSYVPATESDGQVVVFTRNGSIVHSVLFDPATHKYESKAGVRGRLSTHSLSEAAQGIEYDGSCFYRSAGDIGPGSLRTGSVSLPRE
jgi:hypothetical protein